MTLKIEKCGRLFDIERQRETTGERMEALLHEDNGVWEVREVTRMRPQAQCWTRTVGRRRLWQYALADALIDIEDELIRRGDRIMETRSIDVVMSAPGIYFIYSSTKLAMIEVMPDGKCYQLKFQDFTQDGELRPGGWHVGTTFVGPLARPMSQKEGRIVRQHPSHGAPYAIDATKPLQPSIVVTPAMRDAMQEAIDTFKASAHRCPGCGGLGEVAVIGENRFVPCPECGGGNNLDSP